MVAARAALRGTVSLLVAYALVLQVLLAGLAGVAGAGGLSGPCASSVADQGDRAGDGLARADCCLASCLPLLPPEPRGAAVDPTDRGAIGALYAVAAVGVDHSRTGLLPRARAPPS